MGQIRKVVHTPRGANQYGGSLVTIVLLFQYGPKALIACKIKISNLGLGLASIT